MCWAPSSPSMLPMLRAPTTVPSPLLAPHHSPDSKQKTVLCPVCLGLQTKRGHACAKPFIWPAGKKAAQRQEHLPPRMVPAPWTWGSLHSLLTGLLEKPWIIPKIIYSWMLRARTGKTVIPGLWNSTTSPCDAAGILLLLIDSYLFYQLGVWHCFLTFFFHNHRCLAVC